MFRFFASTVLLTFEVAEQFVTGRISVADAICCVVVIAVINVSALCIRHHVLQVLCVTRDTHRTVRIGVVVTFRPRMQDETRTLKRKTKTRNFTGRPIFDIQNRPISISGNSNKIVADSPSLSNGNKDLPNL